MNRIDPAHIGFDIDGVVADTGGAFIRMARENYGINSISLEDITSFEVIDCLNIDQTVIEEIFFHLLDDPLTAGLQPMDNAVAVLNRFAGAAPLTFITARPNAAPIARWLEHHLPPAAFQKTRLVAMGEHDKKTSYIKELGLQYFVDDRLQTCQMLAAEGLSPFVYDQPWNRNGHNLPTVNDWLTIEALCFT